MVAFNIVKTVSDQVYFSPALHPLVVINSTFADARVPWRASCPDAEFFLLSGDRDGVGQISALLKDRTDISSLHLVSHGYPGALYLGDTELNLNTLKHYVDPLRVWAAALYDGATNRSHTARPETAPSLYLYNTRTGIGDAGIEFIERLHQITGLKVIVPQLSASWLVAQWQASSNPNARGCH